MALPTNIVATPNTSLASELPRTVTISGTNIFERPSYTDRELFTQTGSDINLYGTWSLDNSSPTGSETFNVNAINTWARTESQLVDPRPNKFLGVSLWFKRDGTGGTTTNSTLLRITGTVANLYTDLVHIGGAYLNGDGINVDFFGAAGYSTHARVFTAGGTIDVDTWYHLYCYLDDPSDSASLPHLFIDGVEVTHYQSKPTTWDYHEPFRQDVGGSSIKTGNPNLSYVGGSISDVYVSSQPDFANQLNAYYTNTNIPTSSYDELLDFVPTSTGDVPVSRWISTTQADGFIGKAGDFDGVNDYINMSSKIPTVSTFIGMAFGLTLKSLSGAGEARILSLASYDLSPYTDDRTFEIVYRTDAKISVLSKHSGFKFTDSSITLDIGRRYRIFTYLDLSTPSNDIKLYIDGVDRTAASTPVSFSTLSTPLQFLLGCKKFDTQAVQNFGNVIINNFYWSTNPDFKNHLDKYSNLPTVEVN